MKTTGPLLFVLSLVASFAYAGCWMPGGCDPGELSYELLDGDYIGTPTSDGARRPAVGGFVVDGSVRVEVDAVTRTAVVSFDSDGDRVEMTYDTLDIESPFYL